MAEEALVEKPKGKRPVGEDMGPKSPAKDRYGREISIIWKAIRGQRPKACVPIGVLDEIPNKFLPASVTEFLYGLREGRLALRERRSTRTLTRVWKMPVSLLR